jgi:hypothetical protein
VLLPRVDERLVERRLPVRVEALVACVPVRVDTVTTLALLAATVLHVATADSRLFPTGGLPQSSQIPSTIAPVQFGRWQEMAVMMSSL